MSKNPFELRFETLMLARQHLMDLFYAQRENQQQQMERGLPLSKIEVAVYPSPEKVMELATKFRSFVDDPRA